MTPRAPGERAVLAEACRRHNALYKV